MFISTSTVEKLISIKIEICRSWVQISRNKTQENVIFLIVIKPKIIRYSTARMNAIVTLKSDFSSIVKV